MGPLDGGYGWVIVVSAFLVHFVVGIGFTTYPIFLPEFVDSFHQSQAILGLLGSLEQGSVFLVGCVSGALLRRLSCRVVCFMGLSIISLALLACTYVTNFIALLIVFGIFRGVGAGLLFLPPYVIVQQYFDQKRALAAGLAGSGVLAGQISGPIIQLLIQDLSWRGACLALAILPLQVIVFAALMRPPPHLPKTRFYQPRPEKPREDSTPLSEKDPLPSVKKRALFSSMRRVPLWLLTCTTMGMQLGVCVMASFTPARAVEAGIPREESALSMLAFGLGGTVATVLGGVIGNSKKVNRTLLFASFVVAGGCVLVTSAYLPVNIATLYTTMAVFGCALGFSLPLVPTVTTDIYGVYDLHQHLAFIMFFRAIIAFLALPFAGMLYDASGHYAMAYFVVGLIVVVCGVCGIFLRFTHLFCDLCHMHDDKEQDITAQEL